MKEFSKHAQNCGEPPLENCLAKPLLNVVILQLTMQFLKLLKLWGCQASPTREPTSANAARVVQRSSEATLRCDYSSW